MMKMMKMINTYYSKEIDDLLGDIDPKTEKKIAFRMKLAAKIDNARINMGLSKKQFAEQMSKKPSEITKWLSGTHNFTSDTLYDIQECLHIQLIDIDEGQTEQIIRFLFEAKQKENRQLFAYSDFNFFRRFNLELKNDFMELEPDIEFFRKLCKHEKKQEK